MAAATTTIRVGSNVLGNDYRHPVVVAKELASLDLLSDGRLDVGLGAGWLRSDYDTWGVPIDPPAVRVSRLAESITILKALWTGDQVAIDGNHYTVRAPAESRWRDNVRTRRSSSAPVVVACCSSRA